MATTPSTPGKYVYKIAPSHPAVPTTATGTLPEHYTMAPSALDRTSGFIHLSTAAQVPGTLRHFFASPAAQRASVFLLRLPYEPLAEAGVVRWESPDAKICGPREGEGMFPHVYFPDGRLGLGHGEVDGVREVVSPEGEDGWDGGLGRLDGWMV